MVFRRAVPITSIFLTIITVTLALAQQPAPRVAKIEVEGLERLSTDEEPEIEFTRNRLNLNADVIIEFKN